MFSPPPPPPQLLPRVAAAAAVLVYVLISKKRKRGGTYVRCLRAKQWDQASPQFAAVVAYPITRTSKDPTGCRLTMPP